MKTSELTKFRNRVKAELEKRKTINQYLDIKDVFECLTLMGIGTDKRDLSDIRAIIAEILKSFVVKETNGIYVCTKAFDKDSHSPIIYYGRPDDNYDYKCYVDIESREEIKTDFIFSPCAYDFERTHIVLNPFDAPYNDSEIVANGFEEVRLDFFDACYNCSQSKAVQKILEKYPRIGSNR